MVIHTDSSEFILRPEYLGDIVLEYENTLG